MHDSGNAIEASSSTGHPVMAETTSTTATGRLGDFFVDSTARLWFCKKASVGATPAIWKQIA